MSFILAKIFGLYFLAIGIAFIVNPDRLKRLYRDIAGNDSFNLLGGILALLIGAFVVSVHNTWIMGWPLIITLWGWWSLIKGFGLIVYSNFLKYFSWLMNRSQLFFRITGAIMALLGIFLMYHGWQGTIT